MDDYLMTVGKIVCDLVHVFDWCFYIPIAIHKDDRDVTFFRGAEFIAQLVEFLETGKMDLLPAEIQVEKFRRFTPPKFAIDPAKTK